MREDRFKDVFHASHILRYIAYFTLMFILFGILVLVLGLKEWSESLLFTFAVVFAFTGWPLFPILGIGGITEKLVISARGIKHSNIFKKVECSWEDILEIEIVSHRLKYKDGQLASSWIDYNIHSSTGDISLDGLFWKDATLKKIYESIRSRTPNITILEKEEERIQDITHYTGAF